MSGRHSSQVVYQYSPNGSVAKHGGKPIVLKNTRNIRNVWSISTSCYSGAHFAVFLEEIPRVCIKAASRPGDVVLDPFGGSGTTGKVACEQGRTAASFRWYWNKSQGCAFARLVWGILGLLSPRVERDSYRGRENPDTPQAMTAPQGAGAR